MLGWGLEVALRNTSASLFGPRVLRKQHAHVQVLQPTSWVLFINSCLAGSMPSGEHSGEEGIFQHLFYLLHNGCTLKTVRWVGHLPAHWLRFLGCSDWCSPTCRQKGILKRS